jgi:hypothetical protein
MTMLKTRLVHAVGLVAIAVLVGSGMPSIAADDSAPGVLTLGLEVPREPPPGTTSGRLRTPIGPARWIHISGTADTVPEFVAPWRAPGGYLGFDVSTGQQWSSPDLATWTRLALPVETTTLIVPAADRQWLVTSDPTTLWSSTDLERWDPIDLSGLHPVGPPGLAWDLRLGLPAASGDIVTVPFAFHARDTFELLGLSGSRRAASIYLKKTPAGLFEAGDGEAVFATLDFEVSGEGLEVLDSASGESLASIDGVERDFVERWAATGELIDPYVGVIEHDRLVMVDPAMGIDRTGEISVFGTEAGFVGYGLGSDGVIHVWQSGDGRAWTETESLGDDSDEPSDARGVFPNPTKVTAVGDGRWESVDGLSWVSIPERPEDSSLELPGAWVSLAKATLRFHVDGRRKPVVVDLTRLGFASLGEGHVGRAFNLAGRNTIMLNRNSEGADGRREIWLFTFDDLPA